MKHFIIAILTATLLSGCATSAVVTSKYTKEPSNSKIRTKLLDDNVIAFGSPSPTSGLSQSDLVIVGEKHSYVLTEGGQTLVNLLTNLEPKNIQLNQQLEFYSSNNDGKFNGTVKLSYTKPKNELTQRDMQVFSQNGGKDCTAENDNNMNIQRYCFKIDIQGGIYPQVKNYELVRSQFRSLSHPYSVIIYKETRIPYSTSGLHPVDKIFLFPLAVAFDVVTLPVQIFGIGKMVSDSNKLKQKHP